MLVTRTCFPYFYTARRIDCSCRFCELLILTRMIECIKYLFVSMFIARPYFIEGEYSTKIVNKNLQVLARWFLDTFFPYSLVNYFVFKMCGDTENCKFNTYTAKKYIDKMYVLLVEFEV